MDKVSPITINKSYHILAAIKREENLRPLLSLAHLMARTKQGRLTLLHVNPSGEQPEWLEPPAADQNLTIHVAPSDHPARYILSYINAQSPDLLLVAWGGRHGYHLGPTLEMLLRQAICPIAVVRAGPEWPAVDWEQQKSLKILVPASGGPNAALAIELGLNLSTHSEVTAVYVAYETEDEAKLVEEKQWLHHLPWRKQPRFKAKLLLDSSVAKAILTEAKKHDLTILGASQNSAFSQAVFGTLPRRVALENEGPTLIVQGAARGVLPLLDRVWRFLTHPLPNLSIVERIEVYKEVRRIARPNVDFFIMIALSAAIASLGLLLNSAAVIIGAMLVAPLMGAIIGLGLGMIQADFVLLRLSFAATLRGILLAIGVGILAGLVAPQREPTAELLARTGPSLLDLGVALFSGLAGAYAICRKDVSNSLSGVAIAVALVPPLATVGIGLSWFNPEIFWGALLLFCTNLVAISATSGFIFYSMGFRPRIKKAAHSSLFASSVLTSLLLLGALAYVLTNLTVASLQEAALKHRIEETLARQVPALSGRPTLEGWKIIEDTPEVVKLEVRVRAVRDLPHQNVVDLQEQVASTLQLDRPLALILIVIPTTTLDPIVPPTPIPTTTNTPTPTNTPTLESTNE